MHIRYRLSLSILLSLVIISTAIGQQLTSELSRAHLDQVKRYNNLNAPNSPTSIVLQKDDGVNYDGIGLTNGGSFEVSARFDATITGAYVGTELTQIEIYINDLPTSCVMKVYDAGTATTPGSELLAQDVTSELIASSWNVITLSSPVPISGNDIWIGYGVTHDAGYYPAGCDAGPAVLDGDWLYNSGSWVRLHEAASTLNYNWNIHGILESSGGPGPATDPIPLSDAADVSINIPELSWTNPSGATSCDVYFGADAGSMTLIHSGSLVSYVSVPDLPLGYSSTYVWRVNEIDGSGTTFGANWTFSTETDPNTVILFSDDFEAGLGNWTVNNLGGTCNWDLWTSATWESSSLPTLPGGTAGQWLGANSDGCGQSTTLNSEIVMTNGIDMSQYAVVTLSYDSDFRVYLTDVASMDVSTDGGSTWTNMRSMQDAVRNEQIVDEDISSICAGQSNVKLKMTYYGAWDYWWCIDNIVIKGAGVVPVELTSFNAKASGNAVNLSWATATETNNRGFEIERKTADNFMTIGYVDGHGTSTEMHSYSFTDNKVESGTYYYRLKQVDFNGSYEYSNVVEVKVVNPVKFSLDQNYPNPFNPSTMITLNLATDSKVKLVIFDILGQEVKTLVNNNLAAGTHQLEFNAANLNSGVYFYRVDATGVDGTYFTSVKKMILTR